MTGVGVVNRVITDLADFDVTETGLVLTDMAPGVTLEEIYEKTDATFTLVEGLDHAD